MDDGGLSKPVAVVACVAMASVYFGPTLILRLPPPSSDNNFLIRRFICAVVSVVVTALLLPIERREASYLFGVYGIRNDHIWQALVFPILLTALMYAGSLTLKSLLVMSWLREDMNCS